MKKIIAISCLALMCACMSVTAAPITERSVVKESTVSKTDFTSVEVNFNITAPEAILTDVSISGEVEHDTFTATVKNLETTKPFINSVIWLKNQDIRQLFYRTVSTG